MKLASTIVFVLLLFNSEINAQITKENYKFSDDIELYMEKDTVSWRFQYGATYYSISGNYKKALQTWDKTMSKIPSITAQDSAYFKSFKPQDAKKYILNRSKNEKLIILNEAHNNSRHRVFTTSLLKGLYKNGYRFLGMEMIQDSLLNERKFMIQEAGIAYTNESQSANLIREAIKIGFTLFEYDNGNYKTGKDREIGQAENIARIMIQNPNAKFLIHCGYDHLNEGIPGIKQWEKAMAARVNDLTGVNPFTIDQIPGSEKGDLKFNSPYIQLANIKKPSVMLNAKGEIYNGKINTKRADCTLIFPISTYTNERPDWLKLEGMRKPFTVPTQAIATFPVLVFAYHDNEFDQNGVPADVVEITDKKQNIDLILEKGNYRIIVKNRSYKTIQNYAIKIK
ncbi:hypothetical protein [Flavobacterium sp.]|uniref:hypothetical protein n=1 Tax=Flavobacterium sp. TaxID=239 RepID=UPI0022CA00EE|nr:hypothetical protein [Flavobacterium sp.]MCZ8229719.1 hypothetical protein [Flavobacterium sp.]